MSQMKLYSNPLCPFAARVKIGLHVREAGALFHIQEIDLDAPPAELTLINPVGSVPTIEFAPGDGFNESLVVLEFLDTLETKGPRLFGDSPREMGKTKVLLEAASARLLSPLQGVLYARGNAVSLRKAVASLPGAFEWLTGALAKKGTPFFGGRTLGAIDCALAPFIVRYVLLREARKDLPLPKEGTAASDYFSALRSAPSVATVTPTLEQLAPVFLKYNSPEEGVRTILAATRGLVANPEERCAQLNEGLAALQPRNVQSQAGTGEPIWRLERAEKGPQLTAAFRMAGYAEMQSALDTLTVLQESADHHTHFVLEGYHSLSVTVCTHEPVWGLSDKDFAFAQTLTEKLSRL